MAHIKVMRGDIYDLMKEKVNCIVYDVEFKPFGYRIKPVKINKYEEDDLELISRGIIYKAYCQKVVWYLEFSGTESEITACIDLLCDILKKILSNMPVVSDKGELTLLVDNTDNYVLDYLKSKITSI